NFCIEIRTKSDDVYIDDYSWIGANVFIGPGVKIGRNSVVGANSVVTCDIPDNQIWGGVPARLIRTKKT
ncbi:acyltransferase, partial [Vibrio cholerae]|nr:acyltransferase [Vibrio cholerae]